MQTINSLALMIIAGINCYTAYLVFRTRNDVHVLEKNTNSIKDALVATTNRAGLAEGEAIGREKEKISMQADRLGG